MAIYSKKTKSKQNLDKNLKLKVGISLTVIFGLLLINLAFNILSLINSFFLGTFGLFSYAIFLSVVVIGILLILNKSYKVSKIDIALFSLWLFFFICMLQSLTTIKLPLDSFKDYLVASYNYKLTAGGIVFSIFSYPLIALTHTFVSAVVLFLIALVIVTTLIVIRFYNYFKIKNLKTIDSVNETNDIEHKIENLKTSKQSNNEKPAPQFDDSIFVEDEEIEKLEKENKITELTTSEKDKIKAKSILGLNRDATNIEQQNENKQVLKDIFKATESSNINNDRPPRYVHENTSQNNTQQSTKRTLSERDRKNLEYLRVITGRPINDESEEPTSVVAPNKSENNLYFEKSNNSYNFNEDLDTNKEPLNNQTQTEMFNNKNYDDDIYDENLTFNDVKNDFKNNNYSSYENNTTQTFKRPPIIKEDVEEEINLTPIQTEPKKMAQMVMGEVAGEKYSDKPKYKKPYHYIKPPIDLLNIIHNENYDENENIIKGQTLEETLASFKAPAKIVSIKRGPAFSRFEMQMPSGIPVNKIVNYSNDIAMAVQSNGAIRMEIPIPKKNTFGIEVPNKTIDVVGIRDIIESSNFQNSKSPLTFSLGKDITGEAKVAKLDKLIHLLVAGATGSGKSVCLNTMLISFLYHASPEDVKIILVDPKQVEFNLYKGIPHLLIPEIITDPDRAVMMLEWACNEMDRRYKLLSSVMARNIADYNEKDEVKDGIKEKLPYIVIVLDEVGDLMLTHKKEIEDKIVRLGQKARASGIHMVIATQRPSVDIITGTIKANLPSRIAFAVTSFENSKTIIGCGGAENLLGRGDMLLSDQASPDLERIQGAYVSDKEIENVVNFVKENNECVFDSDIEDAMFNPKTNSFNADGLKKEAFDPLLKDALRCVLRTNRASVSGVQRALGVGYPKAGKLIDQMENAGFISEPDSKNNRIIFITQQEFEERFGEDL